MAAAFDLTRNPFHLLNLSVQASRDAVVEAYEEALADGRVGEAELVRAQQAVLTPRTRIEAELAWLPGLPPSQACDILSSIASIHWQEAYRALDDLEGLDKANLAADLCVRSSETSYLYDLFDAYTEITATRVMEMLTGLHSISEFPLPDRQQVDSALDGLRAAHARAAVACIIADSSPGEAMTHTVLEVLEWGSNGARQLLDLIVREYDAWSQPELGMIREKIQEALESCRTGGHPAPVKQLAALFQTWHAISEPVQLLEKTKGHEEPRSKEVCDIVRAFCLWLANEHQRYDEALAISLASFATFSELPAVAAQLTRDIDALTSLSVEKNSLPLMVSLFGALDAIRDDPAAFAKDAAFGFGVHARGLVKRLSDAFSAVVAATSGSKIADTPWTSVCDFAIELNNDHDAPHAASALLAGLLGESKATPSQAVKDKLSETQQTLHRNLKWRKLRRTLDLPAQGIALVAELLDGADGDERKTLLQLKAALERKQEAQKRRRVGWGVAAAVFFGLAMLGAAEKSSKIGNSAPNYVQARAAYQPTSPSASPLEGSSAEERAPVFGSDRLLEKNEVRYCVFQGERLDALHDLVAGHHLVAGESEIERYNALVDDYNLRCASFRYRDGVLQAVERELAGERAAIDADAARMLASLRGAAPSTSRPSSAPNLMDLGTRSGARLIQSELKKLGLYSGRVDGVWGPASRAALRRFKSSHRGLDDDDRWDLAAQQALMNR